jgi:hypothetical protein
LFSFFFEGLKRRHYNSEELYDNSCIDIWCKTHKDDRKLFESSSHK